MFETIRRSWEIIGNCMYVLRRDKTLAIFPFISSLSTLALLIIIWSPFLPGLWQDVSDGQSPNAGIYLLGFISAYIATFITVFFNVALVSCARRSFQGEDTKVLQGIALAMKYLPQIATWALVSVIVGFALRALDSLADKVPFPLSLIANIGVWLLGMAWAVMTYFVIPVIVVEELGGIDTVKRSGEIVSKKWGEAVVGTVSIGAIAGLMIFVISFVLLFLSPLPLKEGAILWTALTLIIMVISSTLTQIYQTALYGYVTGGPVPSHISTHILETTFRARKRSRFM